MGPLSFHWGAGRPWRDACAKEKAAPHGAASSCHVQRVYFSSEKYLMVRTI